MTIIHNKAIQKVIKSKYTIQDIQAIRDLLTKNKALRFTSLGNGLFPAAASSSAQYTGYKYMWVRDNIYVAYSHYMSGEFQIAAKTLSTLMSYFKKFRYRLEAVINKKVDLHNAMTRPHIRFNGDDLSEIEEPWEHAQNDALGYFLWLYCKFATDEKTKNKINVQESDIEILKLFPLYFRAIRYWQDEDSGHWEEGRKIEGSSIGVVVAGLKALRDLYLDSSFTVDCNPWGDRIVNIDLLDELIGRGISALDMILPSECIQPEPNKRRYDAALLFLIYPLHIVEGEMAEQILSDVINHLQGDYGIRRYLGDSFWCRNFQELPKEIRTSKHTDRERWLTEHGLEVKTGEEAQWCIFDPIISAIYGHRFQNSLGQESDLEQQIYYLNRSLGQITGKGYRVDNVEVEEFRCPELYYLQLDNYVPNISTPLLWTQANLNIALEMMEQSLRRVS